MKAATLTFRILRPTTTTTAPLQPNPATPTPEPNEQTTLPVSVAHAEIGDALNHYAHRIRDGRISLYTKDRDSPTCPNEFLMDFSYFCMHCPTH